MATPCTKSLGCESGGHKHGDHMEQMRGACFAGSASPFCGRERTAVDIDVCPEPRSLRCLRYHDTCLALESVEESSAAVSKPRSVWLRICERDLREGRVDVDDDDVYALMFIFFSIV